MTSRLTPKQIQLMKDELTTELAGYLVDDYHYTPEEAIHCAELAYSVTHCLCVVVVVKCLLLVLTDTLHT